MSVNDDSDDDDNDRTPTHTFSHVLTLGQNSQRFLTAEE